MTSTLITIAKPFSKVINRGKIRYVTSNSGPTNKKIEIEARAKTKSPLTLVKKARKIFCDQGDGRPTCQAKQQAKINA